MHLKIAPVVSVPKVALKAQIENYKSKILACVLRKCPGKSETEQISKHLTDNLSIYETIHGHLRGGSYCEMCKVTWKKSLLTWRGKKGQRLVNSTSDKV